MSATLTHCRTCGQALPADAPHGHCPYCLLNIGAPASLAGLHTDVSGATGSAHAMHGFVPPSPSVLQEYFSQFEIMELLGRGGMGAVYLARQRSLDRLVAIKILPPEIASAAGFQDRFAREGRALAKLNHPGIVAVYDFGKCGPYAYLVLEYIDGVNLRTLLKEGHLSPSEALQVVPQICDALHAAHSQGIVHRDIKPENILLNIDGKVKIADFGVAKIAESETQSMTRAGGVVGTFQYMAPEQFERPTAVDHRADIYSLGVVFYEMLTGELPLGRFQAPSERVQAAVGLDSIVMRTLEKQPDMRYASAAEVRTDIDDMNKRPPRQDRTLATWKSKVTSSLKEVLPTAVVQPWVGLRRWISREQAAAQVAGPQAPAQPVVAAPVVAAPVVAAPVVAAQPAAVVTSASLLDPSKPLAMLHSHAAFCRIRLGIQRVKGAVLGFIAWILAGRLPIVFALVGFMACGMGVAAALDARRGSDEMLALSSGVCIGAILLRISLQLLGDRTASRWERWLIVYPLGLAVFGFTILAYIWPLLIAVGFVVISLIHQFPHSEWFPTDAHWLRFVTSLFLLTFGLNAVLWILLPMLFPRPFTTLTRPCTIRISTSIALLMLFVAVTISTIGAMMTYSIVSDGMQIVGTIGTLTN